MTLSIAHANRRAGGIAFIVAALACFSALDTSTKIVATAVPVVMVMWMRTLVQTVSTAVVLMPTHGLALLRTRRAGMHIARGLLVLSSSVTAYFSLQHMHVGEFTAIAMLTPLLLTVIAAWALREPVSALRWLCVVGGFAGTLAVIRPGRELFQLATLLPLLLVASNAAYQVLTSRLASTDEPGTMHFYTGLTGLVATALVLPFAWQDLPRHVWAMVGLISMFSTLGHFLLIVAYSRAQVAVLTPYLYLQIAFAALGGWIVFSHVPDAWSLAGIAVISFCGVFGTWLTGREALGGVRRDPAVSRIVAIAAAASTDPY